MALKAKDDFGSRPRFGLIDKQGAVHSVHATATQAGEVAKCAWPNQEQDEDRAGNGWDVQALR